MMKTILVLASALIAIMGAFAALFLSAPISGRPELPPVALTSSASPHGAHALEPAPERAKAVASVPAPPAGPSPADPSRSDGDSGLTAALRQVHSLEEQPADFLTPRKRRELARLKAQLAQGLLEMAVGGAVDADAVAELHRAYDAEIASLLTPAELFEHELRTSSTAQSLRAELEGIDVTDDEFRTIYILKSDFEAEFATPEPFASPEQRAGRERRRAEALAALAYDMRMILGDQRDRERRYAKVLHQSPLGDVVDEHGVDRDTAYRALEMTETAVAEADRIRSDPGLSPERRQESLDELRARAEQDLGRLLGEAASRRYVDREFVIRTLNQMSPPTPWIHQYAKRRRVRASIPKPE